MLKPKNIVIFILVAVALVLIYMFFIKSDEAANDGLVSTTPSGEVSNTTTPNSNNTVDAKNFLGILLSVKGINLDDSIFSDIAFSTLRDSSITLTPDGSEGRPNPFAPIGTDRVVAPVNNTSNQPASAINSTPTSAPLPPRVN